MKKTLLLTLALGLAGASSLMAGTIDVYITGSTAFRGNVYTACQRLFTTGLSTPVYYASAANGGSDSTFNSKTSSWAMSGTPVSTLTNLNPGANTLIIHGLFTGSIQGLQTVENSVKLKFANADGSAGGNCSTYSTNTPTIGFSDASGGSAPYPATTPFVEENVCVQPFVWCTSVASTGAVTNITNITWEQAEYGIPAGNIPLSAWTYKAADTNKLVYLLQRTADSGTRRTETAGEFYEFNDPVQTYIYDYTNGFWYLPTTNLNTANGASPNGVIGSEGSGNGNANLNWGYGYIGGGDIATSLKVNNVTNQAIAFLSMGDSQGISLGGANTNWATVVSYDGLWPTVAGSGIHGNPSITNDFSPITLGYYPLWGFEVLVYDTVQRGDQDITTTELGQQGIPGSFMGVFNHQTLISGGSPLTGSIENEIELSKTVAPGATAIRLSDMVVKRPSVGGKISPM